MKQTVWIACIGVWLLSSCVMTKHGAHPGVGRVRLYEFCHRDVPPSFDGFRLVWASDFHYKSRFGAKRLKGLVQTLRRLQPDALLLGGDYQEGCEYVAELVEELARVNPPYGTYGVMGNNDYERCHDVLAKEMEAHGIRVLEHRVDTLRKDGEQILLAGVRNPFDLQRNGRCPTLDLNDDDFVVLMVHTPDYVEQTDTRHTDLALAGHTHGGQVTLFGWAPRTASHYGRKFRTGRRQSSAGVPVWVTNGIGTSRRKLRLMAPSEVVVVTLRTMKS